MTTQKTAIQEMADWLEQRKNEALTYNWSEDGNIELDHCIGKARELLAKEQAQEAKPTAPAGLIEEIGELARVAMQKWDGVDIARIPKEIRGYRGIYAKASVYLENYTPLADKENDEIVMEDVVVEPDGCIYLDDNSLFIPVSFAGKRGNLIFKEKL